MSEPSLIHSCLILSIKGHSNIVHHSTLNQRLALVSYNMLGLVHVPANTVFTKWVKNEVIDKELLLTSTLFIYFHNYLTINCDLFYIFYRHSCLKVRN